MVEPGDDGAPVGRPVGPDPRWRERGRHTRDPGGTCAGQHGRGHRRIGDQADLCRELGAEITIAYRDEDFVERVRAETAGAGADVILDIMGAAYLDRNVDALATDGQLIVIGMQGGTKAELNLGKLIAKRAGVVGTRCGAVR